MIEKTSLILDWGLTVFWSFIVLLISFIKYAYSIWWYISFAISLRLFYGEFMKSSTCPWKILERSFWFMIEFLVFSAIFWSYKYHSKNGKFWKILVFRTCCQKTIAFCFFFAIFVMNTYLYLWAIHPVDFVIIVKETTRKRHVSLFVPKLYLSSQNEKKIAATLRI